jgi:hypothetical protein
MGPADAYHAESSREGTWIDRYYSAVGLPIPIVGFLTGLGCYSLGLAVAFSYGFQRHYVGTAIVYLGAFGVGWVTAWVRWGMLNLPDQLQHIRSCFVMDDADYQMFTDRWLRRLRNTPAALSVSFALALVAWAVVYGGLFAFAAPVGIARPHVLPTTWYEGNTWMNMVLLDSQALIAALPLGTGIWLLFINALLLRTMNDLPVVPLPGLLVARFRTITGFYLKIASSWFVGVGIFGIVFFKHLDIVAAFVLLITGSFGLITFFGPQVVFHSFLIRASASIAQHVNELFRQEFKSMYIGSHLSISGVQNSPTALARLADMVQVTQPTPTWVYDPRAIAVLVLWQGLVLAAVAIKPYFVKYFGL